MEFEFKDNQIIFNRELSSLDKIVLKFIKILDKEKIDYVIISGYIAILFGRSRNTEDVDLFIKEMSLEKFKQLWKAFENAGFECIHISSPKEAYEEFLLNKTSIRFAIKGTWLPNFELKFPNSKENFYSINNKLQVILNGKKLTTSEIEMQIAFKLKLGSEKDFEDARHLYKVFKEHLNTNTLKNHITQLRVEKAAEEILWKN